MGVSQSSQTLGIYIAIYFYSLKKKNISSAETYIRHTQMDKFSDIRQKHSIILEICFILVGAGERLAQCNLPSYSLIILTQELPKYIYLWYHLSSQQYARLPKKQYQLDCQHMLPSTSKDWLFPTNIIEHCVFSFSD